MVGPRGVGCRILGLAATVPLLALACGGGGQTASTPKATPHEAMEMQPGAENMKVAISSPASGTMVTANQVALQVSLSGYQPTCDQAGKPNQQGFGHYHVELDKALVNMYCTPQAVISMQNVKPGMHTLTVLPAQNDHAEVEKNAQSIMVDYEPAQPLPQVAAASGTAKPSIKILSPTAGSKLSGPFDVSVDVSNFNLSCDLLGKADVSGYGHWHLNFDSDTGPMMGMMTMAGMSCGKSFHSTTQGLKPGKHTLIALLTDNGHAPFKPDIADRVEVTVAG